MQQLRAVLNSLKDSTLEVTTEYSKVSGTLIEVKPDYITLRSNSSLLYIPLGSIQNIAY
ncbi:MULTISPECIES: DUF2642 domain-containing protein [Solibacillus]|uniref:DUF2642 domain-containing protein n=1 Tax=Solibacillus merdavium TaxID=2762218 RepID=A0ABR8XIB0_9BACL|nr:DUF2642 domain-containing protein [Solibacillus merdavium]MBD8031673.1 DUF2642 domain-containing protein [Solibacillus merdavium]